ncbi:MAG: phosphonate ABC transporter, permease protein PhnE [Alphaproteobacteria bacterium]
MASVPHTVPALPEAALAPLLRAYEDAVAAKRRRSILVMVIVLLAVAVAALAAEVRPLTLLANIGRFTDYIGRIFVFDGGALAGRTVLLDIGEWFWGIDKWLVQLAETLLIAYVGTAIGFVGGFVLCFPAARNTGRIGWLRFLTKRYLEFCRTVPELVFALIFVVAFSLGPLPGVLAIAIHTTGALGKLFQEVVENVDMKPVDGTIAAGATWSEMVRFAVVPQVLSNFASYTLLRFEINVRGASVMGFVGAGGIGQDLIEAIRKFYYTDVSAILVLIIATVVVIDLGTERLRHHLIGWERRR